MSRNRLMLAAVAISCGIAGCAGPRFVAQDQFGGVIALPSNSDYWPTHYRSKAEQMMASKCPQGYVIEHEEEVVVGQTTTARASTDSQTQDVPGRKRRSDLQLTTTETTHTAVTQDVTEYRIAFRAKTASGMSGSASSSNAPITQTPQRSQLGGTN
jgi:hypothetical protein